MELSVQNVFGLLLRSRLLPPDEARALFARWQAQAKDPDNAGDFARWSEQWLGEYREGQRAEGKGQR